MNRGKAARHIMVNRSGEGRGRKSARVNRHRETRLSEDCVDVSLVITYDTKRRRREGKTKTGRRFHRRWEAFSSGVGMM